MTEHALASHIESSVENCSVQASCSTEKIMITVNAFDSKVLEKAYNAIMTPDCDEAKLIRDKKMFDTEYLEEADSLARFVSEKLLSPSLHSIIHMQGNYSYKDFTVKDILDFWSIIISDYSHTMLFEYFPEPLFSSDSVLEKQPLLKLYEKEELTEKHYTALDVSEKTTMQTVCIGYTYKIESLFDLFKDDLLIALFISEQSLLFKNIRKESICHSTDYQGELQSDIIISVLSFECEFTRTQELILLLQEYTKLPFEKLVPEQSFSFIKKEFSAGTILNRFFKANQFDYVSEKTGFYSLSGEFSTEKDIESVMESISYHDIVELWNTLLKEHSRSVTCYYHRGNEKQKQEFLSLLEKGKNNLDVLF